MIKLIKRILGIGAKPRKPKPPKHRARKKYRRANVQDSIDAAVAGIVQVEKAERKVSLQRYKNKNLNVNELERIIDDAITQTRIAARVGAREAATLAANRGKRKEDIVGAGRQRALSIFRKAIVDAIHREIDSETSQEKHIAKQQPRHTTDLPSVLSKQRDKVRRDALRERKRANANRRDGATAHSALDIPQGNTASHSESNDNGYESTQKLKSLYQPDSESQESSTESQSTGTLEENEIRAELESLQAREAKLRRTMRKVTYHGGKKSKNADYHDTKEQLIAIEERIKIYERALAKASSSMPMGSNNVVQIGSTIVLKFSDSDEHETFRIVTTPLGKKGEAVISADSPIGSALMGKRIGDYVTGVDFERIQIVDLNNRNFLNGAV